MANGQLEIVLRHIHQLAAAHNGAELTDGQLLEQFAGGEQESAFTALVRRHGPMVLGVCRRVLHDRHLAEDAFQATFLVLFRKARSLDRRGSVASWLYTVAYHAALRARADSARRHRQERQVREMSPPRATADTAVPPELWHDLRPVLDEELSRLPEKYRSAVLLCYVEGKTNEEAARLLRVPAGTIKSRLSRARELLRSRLSRRGVTLSAGLVGAVLAEHATAAVPAGLVHITVQTALLSAAGLASAPAAALAEGVLHAMFATKLKIATVFVVAVGVAAIGIGTITHRALAQRQQDVAVAEAPKSKPLTPSPSPQRGEGRKKVQADEQEMTVTGRVVDAKGRPVPNAGVAAAAFSYHGKRGGDLSDNLNRVFDKGQADREGRFQLTFRRSTSLASYSEAYLFAAAKGFGFGWQTFDMKAAKAEVTVQLLPEQFIRGRLLDLQGQPAAKVKVRVSSIERSVNGQDTSIGLWNPATRVPLWPEPVTTDADGRFIIHGLNREKGVNLEIQDDRFARQWLRVESEKKQPTLSHTLLPAQIVEGRAVAEDTGKAVPHAHITTYSTDHEFGGGIGMDGDADEQGRFRLNPFPGRTLTVTAYAPAGQPYLIWTKMFQWPKGSVKYHLEMRLPRGVLVRGKVTEAGSGKPVVGANIQYRPRAGNNPNVRQDIITGWQGIVLSSGDGTFHIPVLPGKGHLLVGGPTLDFIHQELGEFEIYNEKPGGQRFYPDAFVKLDIPAKTETKDVTVTLHRGVTVKGRVTGPDGKPVAGGVLICRLNVEPSDGGWRFPRYFRDGQFELRGLDPEKSYPASFLDPKKQIAATVNISGKQAGETIEVKLALCGKVTARFLGSDGNPLKEFRPNLVVVVTPGAPSHDREAVEKGLPIADSQLIPNIDRDNYWPGPKTGDDGRITFPALVPGLTYRIINYEKGYGVLKKEFTVKAGQTVDLKEITIPIE